MFFMFESEMKLKQTPRSGPKRCLEYDPESFCIVTGLSYLKKQLITMTMHQFQNGIHKTMMKPKAAGRCRRSLDT